MAEFYLSDVAAEEEFGLSTPTVPSTAFPGASLMTFDPDLWGEAREALEEGREPGEAPVVSTAAAPARPAPEIGAGLINVDLPYESGLSIAGRKLIRVKVQETRRKSAQRARELGVPQSQRDFEMHQELQVKIKGKVGRKIAVNVDFDDTKDDKRDISVVYTGDPEEVVQEAAFGDIVLSLPSTEFVSYSKQLFGVRTRLKYKNAQVMAIGSRTKGVTETKRFNGDIKSDRREIPDTSYIRRRYYNIAFQPGRAIRPGTFQIWRDDRNTATVADETAVQTADYVSTTTYTGDFNLLVEGSDYALDLSRGLVILARDAALSDVLVVDYQFDNNGEFLAGDGNPAGAGFRKIIKTSDDLPISPGATPADSGFERELKTFYSIGQTNIVPDDGRGNFLFKTQDLNRLDNAVFLNDPTGNLTGDDLRLRYPDNVEVDFTNGRFNLIVPVVVDTFTAPTHKLYDPTPEHKFSFVVEYKYRVRSYIIKPNIVFGSERVSLNGRALSRDVDYFLDYDSGYLTFFNDEQLDQTSQIEVTYEFAPFGGQLGETLVGARTELDLVPGRFKAGSTLLYNFSPKPTFVPDVRATPRSLLVLEADAQLNEWKVPFTPATLSLSAEVAKSKEDPNLFGRALVDSMEGVKQEIQAILGPEAWRPASNPDQGTPVSPGSNEPGRPDSLWTFLSDETLELRDIIPGVSSERAEDKVRVMNMPFELREEAGLTGDPEMVSIVQPLSKVGLDFSKRVTMDLWVEGAGAAGAGMDLCVNIGEFNEDADRDDTLDTEDTNRDGGLNFGEDGGWLFQDPGSNGNNNGSVVVGPGNNRLDSEDLDGDGVLRRFDLTPRMGQNLFCLGASGLPASTVSADPAVRMVNPVSGLPDQHDDLDFTGWRLITVPLNISSTEETAFQAIKQVRLTVVNDSAAPTPPGAGIRLAKVSFIGTTWDKAVITPALAGGTMTLSAINNVDDPSYPSLLSNDAYKDLYGDEAENRTREQALVLRFDLPLGSTATTRQVSLTPRDFSTHRRLRFFVQVPQGEPYDGLDVALQLGNETDYYEYRFPLTAAYRGFWRMEDIAMTDLNNDGTPDVLTPTNPQARFSVVGSPSFQRIGQMKLAITNRAGTDPVVSEVWINEIHVTGSRERAGTAQRFTADFQWPGWGSLGGRLREVDRNFQTLTAQILNQDKKDASATAAFTRLRWLPLSGNVSKAETVTPAVFRTGDANLISLLSEGRETAVTGRGDGQLLIPHLPAIGFSYDKALAKSTSRGEKRDKDTYTGSADYQLPWAPDVIPGGFLAFRPLPQSLFVRYVRSNSFFSVTPSTGVFSSTDTAFNSAPTVEFSDEWTARAPFSPWTGLTFQPSVSWKEVHEQRRFSGETLDRFPDFSPASSYRKARAQTVGYSGAWRLLSWLEPRFDGELRGAENNVLPTASSPTAFNVKTVERSAAGNFFWTFRAADLAPNFQPTRSLRLDSSIRLESGDAYENVGKDDDSWRRVKLFGFQRIQRKGGRRMYGLLEPLDVTGSGGRRKQLTARNSLRTSLDWTPFDWLKFQGPAEPLRTLRMTATLTNTDEHTETGEAVRDASTVVWPDLLFSIRDTERFFRAERWMANSQLNLRGNRKVTRTFGEDFRQDNSKGSDYHFLLRDKYDVFLSYGDTDGFTRSERTGLLTAVSQGYAHFVQVGTKLGSWQVTPRADFRGDTSVDAAGRATQDTDIQAYSVLLRLDKAYPRGFRIPFTRKIYENVNRLIVDGKLGFERKQSSIDVDRNNTDAYTADVTGEWEISRNFRLSFGGGMSMIENRVRKEDGVLTYNLTSQLVINF